MISTLNTKINENYTGKEVCIRDKNFSLIFESCTFSSRFESCKGKTFDVRENYFEGYLRLKFLFKCSQYVLEVYLRPILGVISILTNSLTIVVIRAKKEIKHFKNPMYKHLFFNCLFNILFSCLNILTLINICIFPNTSFCSSIRKHEAVQYFLKSMAC